MRESTTVTSGGEGDVPFCEVCLAHGADVILRICISCGHVGCAGGSGNDHAGDHYAETDHPIAAGIGSHVAPRWSYPDERSV